MLDPGDRTEIYYPSSNLITARPTMELRKLEVLRARDLVVMPLDPETFFRRPMLRRSRWMIDAIDQADGQPRRFYLGSSREFAASSDLRIALYEPFGTKPYRIVSRGFGDTVRERISLAHSLRAVLRMDLDDLLVRVVADDLRRIG